MRSLHHPFGQQQTAMENDGIIPRPLRLRAFTEEKSHTYEDNWPDHGSHLNGPASRALPNNLHLERCAQPP